MKKELIKKLKGEKIITCGNFTLKSGRKSNIYFDLRKSYGNPQVLNLIRDNLVEAIKNLPEKPDILACSGYGGISIATLLSSKLNIPLSMVRDKPKAHGNESLIEGYIPKEGEKVLVVDDIFSSGTSIKNTVFELQKLNPKILGALVILDRGENKPTLKLSSLIKMQEILQDG